ncbi:MULTISPECIES: PTS sugar transporter subunit IIA [Breznakia]|uniref:PTS system IIA component (Gat family) n=1 Tax=Breznakia blatticola TaxID=1754012 RepID=A0A4R7ZLW2_9FIRM|nr:MULTISPECIES: PTS sugar transporter subunit IIA [Breznakia]MDH6366205.1 PTS system galactitol-specific IIA component [Breznakia sp. PH1-1]MDH6403298.1 PTS system galactitol-specific IIA component [Breznakia sp. PF1-11]MDH6411007.1 PTS system galactitol-specific IIA component [Breznakia sp. PFB1-11]MDH6413371.1 PTS system galactitol-specific IIA component [Breznakia sp. PFB1-14]MDH6416136.1 PTS system galactitol-specific IIA component [Breznakia sp. PFB1-4]
MDSSMIIKDLIQLDMQVENQNDFFAKMSEILFAKGFVKETYYQALVTREEAYPTGLPTQPYPIAIPHADAVHIITPFVAAVRLAKPIAWCEMATSDVWHDVQLIFVLGFIKGDGHVEMLQLLVDNLQDQDLMDRLLNAKTVDEYYQEIINIKGFD